MLGDLREVHLGFDKWMEYNSDEKDEVLARVLMRLETSYVTEKLITHRAIRVSSSVQGLEPCFFIPYVRPV